MKSIKMCFPIPVSYLCFGMRTKIKRPFGGYVKYKDILTKDFLYNEHIVNKKTLARIAREVGCDHGTVGAWIDIHGIKQVYHQYFHMSSKNSSNWRGYEEISATYWKNLKNGAKTRDIDFLVTPEEAWNLYIKQDRKCALSGQPIGFERCKNNTASLDRIDVTKPYVIGNLQWVHRDINFAKQSMNNEEFISMCKLVAEFNSSLQE